MQTQSSDKNNDVKPKTSHKKTLKAHNHAKDLDIEREFIASLTEKGSFESEQSYKNSYDLKGEKASLYKKQERLKTASKAPNDRMIEETVLLSVSAKKPTSEAISDQNIKEAPEISGEDQDSYLNLYLSNLHEQHQQESLRANSSDFRSHSFAPKFQMNSFNSLQELDFTRCRLGKQAIRAFCGNSNLKILKSLILAQNPIRNDGLKFISETSNWPKLQRLILCNIQIDYDGVKWLAMNESWTSLKELDLSENPLIGDLGAISLCLNRTWTSLKTLSLWSCNVGRLGVIASRRRKNQRVLFEEDKTTIEVENQISSFNKVSFKTTRDTQNPKKSLPTYPFICSNWSLQNFKSKIRGGSPQGDGGNDSSDIDHLGLLNKFKQYKEKILNDASLEKELELFIEVQASTIPANHHGINNGNGRDVNQHLKLSFDVRRHLSYSEDSEACKILLLTGQAGIGKSLFCKHLQRELFSDWSQDPDSEDRNLFPIYIELSSRKNFKSGAVFEILSGELGLTNEEILFLEALEKSDFRQIRLLFVFDGYDTIENLGGFHSLSSREDYMNHNFFVLNKIDVASWKNARFLVTCREENLQKVQRRDLLFAPINTQSSELSVESGAFLQRKIEPFSKEQITHYLKKYHCYELKNTAEQGTSWNQVNVFEKMLDNYQLREIATIPFMLSIMCRVLPELVRNYSQRMNNYPQNRKKRFLIEFFVNEVMQSMAEESFNASSSSANNEESKNAHKEDQHQVALRMKEVRQKAQTFALKSRGYIINKSDDERNQDDNPSVLKIHPLASWDKSNFQVRFDYPLLLEFLVAKSIEEEISQIISLKKDLLINQRLLTSEASDLTVTFFLIDAIKDERLKAGQFINLIQFSRQKELDQENNSGWIKEQHASSQSPFTVAAANAITILNALGYNFSLQDLSDISIPSANLRFGIFEGTNFMNANLAGIDFTGAWLKDANLVQANLESIKVDRISSLKLDKQEIKKIVYSSNGEYLAVDVGNQTIIYESFCIQRDFWREKRRFPGYFLSWGALDGTQVVTIVGERILTEEEQAGEAEEDSDAEEAEQMGDAEEAEGDWDAEKAEQMEQAEGDWNTKQAELDDRKKKRKISIYIWDIGSGQFTDELNVPIGDKELLNFNLKRKEVVALDNKRKVQKYDIGSQSWIEFRVEIWNDVNNCELFAKSSTIFLAGDYLRNTILCNSITGKAILNQRQRVTSCKLSSDGRKMVAGTNHGVIRISDCVRGYMIKSLVDQKEDDGNQSKTIFDCSFNADGKQILSRTGRRLTLQDMANLALTNLALPSTELNIPTYCLSPDGQQVAVVEEKHTVSFKKFPAVADLPIQAPTIGGTNNKGLNLQGVIVNSSIKLSEENIAIFQEKGDYGVFNESMIKKLFSNSSADSEDVREVVLIGEKLAPIHARILGNDLLWINLQRLNLSRNDIGEEGGKAIGGNITWANLEELILMSTEIGDETAKAISNNQNLQKLKKLQLAFNDIGDIGAEAIGKNEIWVSLETLDLRQNKIKAQNAPAIGTNDIWKKLVTLDLSSNQISQRHMLIFLSSNKTWEHLQSLSLIGNPVILETSDVCKIIERIASKSLKMLALPQAKFEQTLLQCLKYSAPESVINLSLAKIGCNDKYAEIIAANTTWSTLKKLDLSKNLISDRGGIKIGSNTSWINLEELDLSSNNLGAKSATALCDNTTWSKLRVLNLNGNKIGTEGCYAIGNNKTWTNLQTLELQDNIIGSEGVVALCQNRTWNKLQAPNLGKKLTDVEGAAELAKDTSWINLQTLNLNNNSIGDKGAAALARDTSWINLQKLDLGYNSIGTEGARELARNTSWFNLQTLNLEDNSSIGAEGARELAQNTSWINLQTLNLNNNWIRAEGARELGTNTSWINLQALNLNNNSIEAEGAAELGKNTSWINLQTLNLNNNSIRAEGAAELARNTSWINLKTLDLRSNSIGDQGAAKLARNASWINLQTLDLTNNSIGDKRARELARDTSWVNLQTLNLNNNSIGDKGARELARNTPWINLQTLNLSNNSISDKGARELARNTSWINLQTFDLGYNSIGDKGARELARNTPWINLQTLNLNNNSIGEKGARELARNTSWINLQTFDLCYNSIGDKGTRELATNTSWINLQTLNLNNNSIGDKGAIELATNTSWINLKTINLNNNSVGAEGARELARNSSRINLQTLDLRYNSIGAEGARDLARNTSWINLQTIDLGDNLIGADEAGELARNISWINLQTLDLPNNLIGAHEAAELARNTSWINLEKLDLENNLIGADGAAALALNTCWINLQTLELSHNSIGDKGAAKLAKNESWNNLKFLGLQKNSIGADGAAKLAKNKSWINLQTLKLENNEIGDGGAVELAGNTSWINLQTLDLQNNSIGNKGAAKLATSISWINLQILDLKTNSIDDEGAVELAMNVSWINLQTLNLKHNKIGGIGGAALGKNKNWPKTLKISY